MSVGSPVFNLSHDNLSKGFLPQRYLLFTVGVDLLFTVGVDLYSCFLGSFV